MNRPINAALSDPRQGLAPAALRPRRVAALLAALLAAFAVSLLGSAAEHGARADQAATGTVGPLQGGRPPLEASAQLGGRTQAVAVGENGAYLASGPRLLALDMSDPQRPRTTWHSEPDHGTIADLEAFGWLAAAATQDGAALIDLSGRIIPRVRALFRADGHGAVDVALAPDRLSFLDDGGRLHLCPAPIAAYDPNEPSGRSFRARCESATWLDALHIAGHPSVHVLYAIGPEPGIQVVDAGNAANPAVVATIATAGRPRAILAGTDHLVVACSGAGADAGIEVFDLTDPLAPTAVSRLAMPLADAVSIAAHAAVLYVVDDATGLRIVDLADAAQPKLAGTLPLTGRDVAARDGHVLVAGDDTAPGLRVVDTRDPHAPVAVGWVPVPGNVLDVDVSAEGQAWLLADAAHGLAVLDDPYATGPIGWSPMHGGASRVAAVGGHAYVLGVPDGDPSTPFSMAVVDVSDPTAPARLGERPVPEPGAGWDLAAADHGYAFIGGDGRLDVLDVRDPGDLALAGHLVLPGDVWQLETAGHLVFALVAPRGQWTGGVVIVDVSDPSAPSQRGIVGPRKAQSAMGAAAMAVEDDTLVLAEWLADLPETVAVRAFDIADPSAPRHLGDLDTPAIGGTPHTLGLALGQGYATLGLWGDPSMGGEILLADVGAPAAPEAIGMVAAPLWMTRPSAVRTAHHDGSALLAAGWSGVSVIDRWYDRPSRALDPGGSSPLPLAIEGQTGGATLAVAARGAAAYLGHGPRVEAYDVAVPGAPSRITASALLPGIVQDLVATDAHVFAATYGGVEILDRGSPGLNRLGRAAMPAAEAYRIAVEGDILYATASPSTELHVYDVTDPAAPALVSATGIWSSAFAVEGDLLAVGSGQRLRLYDVSGPSAPRPWMPDDERTRAQVGALALDGDLLYVAMWTPYRDESGAREYGGLAVYDVSDPASPVLVGDLAFDTYGPTLVLDADTAYVAGGWTDEGGAALLAVDVADPTSPRLAGAVAVQALDAALAGETLVAALADDPGMALMDVGDPAAPTWAATVDPMGVVFDVALADGHAFATDRRFGLRVYGEAPGGWAAEAGALRLPYVGNVAAQGGLVALCGTRHEYVEEGQGTRYAFTGTLHVADVGDPAAPERRSTVLEPEVAFDDVALHGGVAFVAANAYRGEPSQLRAYDLADPSNPRLVGSLRLSVTSADLQLVAHGDRVYVGAPREEPWHGGVLMVDVADPAGMVEIGRVEGVTLSGMAVDGHTLYVTEPVNETSIQDATSLRLFDVADAARPVALSTYTWRGTYGDPESRTHGEYYRSSVAVRDGIAYVVGRAADTAGPSYVRVVDVRDPAHPWGVGQVEIPTWYADLAWFDMRVVAGDDRLYLATAHNGLLAMEPYVPEPGSPPLELLRQGGGAAEAIAASGDRLFVGEGPRVAAYGLADPDRPREPVRSELLPGVVADLVERDALVFAATYGGLAVLEIHDADPPEPAELRVVGSLHAVDAPVRQIALSGSLAYLLTAGTAAVPAQLLVVDVDDFTQPRLVGRVEDVAYDAIAASGEVVYASEPGALVALDASRPERPMEVDRLETSVPVDRMRVRGVLLFAAGGARSGEASPTPWHVPGGLAVFDLTTPAHPIPVSELPLDQHDGRDLTLGPQHAYLPSPDGTIAVDVSDPLVPQRVAAGYLPADVAAFVGDRLYLAGATGGVTTVEVSDPGAPDPRSTIDTPGTFASAAFAIGPELPESVLCAVDANRRLRTYVADTKGYLAQAGSLGLPGARQVVTLGALAFVSVSSDPSSADADGIHTIGLTDPTRPAKFADARVNPFLMMAATDGRIYTVRRGGSGHELSVLVSAGGSGILIPGGVAALPGPAFDLVAGGDRAYALVVVRGGTGYDLAVLDAADPMRPRLAGQLRLPLFWSPRMAVSGDRLLVADRSDPEADGPSGTLLDIDVTDAAAPRVSGQYAWHADPAQRGTRVLAVARSGDVAYVLGEPLGGGAPRTLRAIDLGDPARPEPVGVQDVAASGPHPMSTGFAPEAEPLTIAAAPDRLAVAGGRTGLSVLRPNVAGRQTRIHLPIAARMSRVGPESRLEACARRPLHVTYAIDASAPMNDGLAATGVRRLEATRAAVVGALPSLGLGRNSAGIVRFDGQAGRLATGTDLAVLQRALQALDAGRDGRRMDLGLDAAARDIADAHARGSTRAAVVVLHADGEGPDVAAARARADSLRAEGVLLFTVGVGDAADPGVLWNGAAPNGHALRALDESALAEAVRSISADLAACRRGP